MLHFNPRIMKIVVELTYEKDTPHEDNFKRRGWQCRFINKDKTKGVSMHRENMVKRFGYHVLT